MKYCAVNMLPLGRNKMLKISLKCCEIVKFIVVELVENRKKFEIQTLSKKYGENLDSGTNVLKKVSIFSA